MRAVTFLRKLDAKICIKYDLVFVNGIIKTLYMLVYYDLRKETLYEVVSTAALGRCRKGHKGLVEKGRGKSYHLQKKNKPKEKLGAVTFWALALGLDPSEVQCDLPHLAIKHTWMPFSDI